MTMTENTHDAAASGGPVLDRVRQLVDPIVTDLGLDLYDLEQRGGTLRLTVDTPLGDDAGVTLDQIALASRLVGKELDAHDPIPSRYTLEVTSPGVERPLRTADHFRRVIGDEVAIRLRDVSGDERRVQGTVAAVTESAVELAVDDETGTRTIALDTIDRARTVFEWGPQPKPGKQPKSGKQPKATKQKKED